MIAGSSVGVASGSSSPLRKSAVLVVLVRPPRILPPCEAWQRDLPQYRHGGLIR
jgi:hypothetical protein